jgi:hypothetical protein
VGEITRWFYERARGQWEVARIREGTTPKKLKAFDQKTPRSQKVDKNLLAKAANAWDELPHVVSLGGQKCFLTFMKDLGGKGSTWEPDEEYYRESIAKIIIFKRAEKIARQIGFSAYRANAVSSTVALVSYRTCGRLKLDEIWKHQNISNALEETIRSWMPCIHEEIVESAEGRNVTEWCKKKECWAIVQSLDLEFASGFEEELAEGQPLPNVGRFKKKRGAKPKALSPEERERQAKVMQVGPDEWVTIIRWMTSRPEYTGFPVEVCGSVLGFAAAGWQQVPSPNQTKYLVDYLDAWNRVKGNEDEE